MALSFIYGNLDLIFSFLLGDVFGLSSFVSSLGLGYFNFSISVCPSIEGLG